MKQILIVLTITMLIYTQAQAQKDLEITIYDSSIQTAPLHDCGEVDKTGRKVLQYKIINERKTDVEIKNIKTPQGYMASISEGIIESNKNTTLYIILEGKFIEDVGEFSEKVTIQTNLVQDIEIEIKGVYIN